MTKLLFAYNINRWTLDRERNAVTLFVRDDMDHEIAIRLPVSAMAANLRRILAGLEEASRIINGPEPLQTGASG